MNPDLIIIPSNNEPSAKMIKIACEKLYPDTITVIVHDKERKGKGWAFKRALAEIDYCDIIVFLDGDFDINPIEIAKLLPFVPTHDVVIGIKDPTKLKFPRNLVSLGYRLFVRVLFGLNVSDTQTGLKIWKRKTMPEFESDGFSYDIEMLAQAKEEGLSIKEVPITVNIDKKVRLITIWNTLKETIRVWLVLSFQNTMKI